MYTYIDLVLNIYQSRLFLSALQKTCDTLTEEGYEVASYIVDLADKISVYTTAEKVKKEVSNHPLIYISTLNALFLDTLPVTF